MNDLVISEMIQGFPFHKFNNKHICVACECNKKSKKGHHVLIEKSISEPLKLLHIEIYGSSVFETLQYKKYILVDVDDYSWFTCVSFLKLKVKVTSELINFIKGIEVLTKLLVRRV